jgi:hypothetical protein
MTNETKTCVRNHARKVFRCTFRLAGFCTDGSTVSFGAMAGGKGTAEGAHPKWVNPATLPLHTVKLLLEEPEQRGHRSGRMLAGLARAVDVDVEVDPDLGSGGRTGGRRTLFRGRG